MLAGLNAEEVEYVVIGGLAGTIHGAERVTNDLDICYARTPENLARLGRVLEAWHAYPREIPPGLPFSPDARTLANTQLLTLTTDEGDMDVLAEVAGLGDYSALASHTEYVTAFGLTIPILSLPALIRAKRAAASMRPRYREHIAELEALLEARMAPDAGIRDTREGESA